MDIQTKYTLWYGITAFILGLALFFPMKRLIGNIQINRLQKKENRNATDEERERIRKKVVIIAGIISMTFAFLYTKFIMFKYLGSAQ